MTGAAWAAGGGRRWRRTVAKVLERDQWQCRVALAPWTDSRGRERQCLGKASTAHHTLGKALTGDDPAFLVAACQPCNLRVGDPSKAADPPHRPMTRW